MLGASGDSPDSHSRHSSSPSGNAPSEARVEAVKVEDLEEEMVDELAPLFGKVICMDTFQGNSRGISIFLKSTGTEFRKWANA